MQLPRCAERGRTDRRERWAGRPRDCRPSAADHRTRQPAQKPKGITLKKFAAAVVFGCALLATGVAGATTGRTGSGVRATAAPALNWGVADDAAKFADDGGSWIYGQLHGANLTENRWTVAWDPDAPDGDQRAAVSQRAAPKAQAAGRPRHPRALPAVTATAHDPVAFCAWAAKVAGPSRSGASTTSSSGTSRTRASTGRRRRTPGMHAAQVRGAPRAVLRRDPCCRLAGANVIGMGLSPRASTGRRTEPLVFLAGVGEAYRASGRQAPIMDQLSIHPYPNPNSPTDSPDVGYTVPTDFGVSNLDRVKQAVYDAFNGTEQPTTLNGLTFASTRSAGRPTRRRIRSTTTTRTSASITRAAAGRLPRRRWPRSTSPAIRPSSSVELFLLADEPYRNGKDADGAPYSAAAGRAACSPRAATASRSRSGVHAGRSDFAAGRGACKGAMVSGRRRLVERRGSASSASS